MSALTTRITSVAVHRQGAVVTRQGVIAPGTDVYHIEGLPLLLQDGSVRVHVAGATPTDVRVEWALPQLGAELTTVSERDLADMEQTIAELTTQAQVLANQRQLLDRLQPSLPDDDDGVPRPTPITTWLMVVDWQQQARQTIDRLSDDARQKLAAAYETRARMQRARNELAARAEASAQGVSKRVSFRLETALAEQAPVTLEYRVPGARWVPSYELRVARDGQTADLAVRAFVVQASGEPWLGVKLSLSTAELGAQQELGELDSLRIGRAQPPPRASYRPAPADTDLLFAGFDSALQRRPARPTQAAPKPPPPPAPLPPPPPPPAFAAPMPPPGMPPPSMHPQMPGFGAVGGAPPPAPQASRAMAPSPKKKSAPRREMAKKMEVEEEVEAQSVMRSMAAAPAMDFAGDAPMAEMEDSDEGGFDDGGTVSARQANPVYTALSMRDSSSADRGKLKPIGIDDILPQGAHLVRDRVFAAESAAAVIPAFDFAQGTRAVEQSAGYFDYRYDAAGLLDIPNDAQAHNVPLLTARAAVSLLLVVVPRESTDAVRLAQLTNPLPSPLLEGPVDVYWDGEFLVQAPLWTTPKGGKLSVGLGLEPALKVARNVQFEEKSAGLLRGKIELAHEVKIDVASRLERETHVEVREAIPVTTDEGAEIALSTVDPKWEPFDQADTQRIEGGKVWRFKLAPGQDRTLGYTYSIKIDAKRELVGGNRRA